MPAIFISYRKKDTGGHVGHLRRDLAEWYGKGAVFTDFDSIPPGTLWMEEIEKAVDSSDVALVVIGESWVASELDSADGKRTRRIDDDEDVLRKEVRAALEHPKVTVVPVLVEDTKPVTAEDLPEDLQKLSRIHACHLRNDDWDDNVAVIRRAVDAGGNPSPFVKYGAKARLALARHRAAIATAVAAAAVVAVALLLLGGGKDGDPCQNLSLPKDVRRALSPAAGTKSEAEYGVLYGACESQDWAIAEFPDVPSSVFVQENFGWRRLGATAAVKCARIPRELLDEWSVDDC